MIKLEHPNNLLKIRAEKYIKDNNLSEEEVTTISNNTMFFKMSVIGSTLHLYIPPRPRADTPSGYFSEHSSHPIKRQK